MTSSIEGERPLTGLSPIFSLPSLDEKEGERPSDLSDRDTPSPFIVDEHHLDQVLEELKDLTDETHAFRQPERLPAITEANALSKKNIQTCFSSPLTFSFETYTFTRTYAATLRFLNRVHIGLTGIPLKAVIAGSGCPRLLTALWHAEQLSLFMPSLSAFFKQGLDCSIDHHLSDTDTHIYLARGDSDLEHALFDALVNDLIAEHYRSLIFCIKFKLDDNLYQESIQGLEKLIPFLIELKATIVEIGATSKQVPWLHGLTFFGEQLRFFLESVHSIPFLTEEELIKLACQYLFQRSLEDMQDFVRTHALRCDPIFKTTMQKGENIVEESRLRFCLRAVNGDLHDLNLISVMAKDSQRTTFQGMQIQIEGWEEERLSFAIQATPQTILDKYCKLLRWIHPENAQPADWTYYWFLITQGYRDALLDTKQILLQKFILSCREKGTYAPLLLSAIQAEFNRRNGKSRSEAIALAFNCAAALLGSEFPKEELSLFWQIFVESLSEWKVSKDKSSFEDSLEVLLMSCRENFSLCYAHLQLRAFLWLKFPGLPRMQNLIQFTLTHSAGSPTIQCNIKGQKLQLPFYPTESLKLLSAETQPIPGILRSLNEILPYPSLESERAFPSAPQDRMETINIDQAPILEVVISYLKRAQMPAIVATLLNKFVYTTWLSHERESKRMQEFGPYLYQHFFEQKSILAVQMAKELLKRGFFSIDEALSALTHLYPLFLEKSKEKQIQGLFSLLGLIQETSKHQPEKTLHTLFTFLLQLLTTYDLSTFLFYYRAFAKQQIIYDETLALFEELMASFEGPALPSHLHICPILSILKENVQKECHLPSSKLKRILFEKFYFLLLDRLPLQKPHFEPLCLQWMEGLYDLLPADEFLPILERHSQCLSPTKQLANLWANFCYSTLNDPARSKQIWEMADKLSIWNQLKGQDLFIVALYDSLENSSEPTSSLIKALIDRYPGILSSRAHSKEEELQRAQTKKEAKVRLEQVSTPQAFMHDFQLLLDLINWRDPCELENASQLFIKGATSLTKKIFPRQFKILCQLLLLPKNDSLFRSKKEAFAKLISPLCFYLGKNEIPHGCEQIACKLLSKYFESKNGYFEGDAPKVLRILAKHTNLLSNPKLCSTCQLYGSNLFSSQQSEDPQLLCELFLSLEQNHALPPFSPALGNILLDGFMRLITSETAKHESTINRFLDRWPVYLSTHCPKGMLSQLTKLQPCLIQLIKAHKEAKAFKWIQQLFLSPQGLESWRSDEILSCAREFQQHAQHEYALTIYSRLYQESPLQLCALIEELLLYPKKGLQPHLEKYSTLFLELLTFFEGPLQLASYNHVITLLDLLKSPMGRPPLSFVQLSLKLLTLLRHTDHQLWIEALKAAHQSQDKLTLELAWNSATQISPLWSVPATQPEFLHCWLHCEIWRAKVLFACYWLGECSFWKVKIQNFFKQCQDPDHWMHREHKDSFCQEQHQSHFVRDYLTEGIHDSIGLDELQVVRKKLDIYLSQPENIELRTSIDLLLAALLVDDHLPATCQLLGGLNIALTSSSVKKMTSNFPHLLVNLLDRLSRVPAENRAELERSYLPITCRLGIEKMDKAKIKLFPLVELLIKFEDLSLIALAFEIALIKINHSAKQEKANSVIYKSLFHRLCQCATADFLEKARILYQKLTGLKFFDQRHLHDLRLNLFLSELKQMPPTNPKLPEGINLFLTNSTISSEKRLKLLNELLNIRLQMLTDSTTPFGALAKKTWDYLIILEGQNFDSPWFKKVPEGNLHLEKWIRSNKERPSTKWLNPNFLLRCLIQSKLQQIARQRKNTKDLDLSSVDHHLDTAFLNPASTLFESISLMDSKSNFKALHLFVTKLLDLQLSESWAKALVMSIAYAYLSFMSQTFKSNTQEMAPLIERFFFHPHAFCPTYFSTHLLQMKQLYLTAISEKIRYFRSDLVFQLRVLCSTDYKLDIEWDAHQFSLIENIIDNLLKTPTEITIKVSYEVLIFTLRNLYHGIPHEIPRLYNKIFLALQEIADNYIKARLLYKITKNYCDITFSKSTEWLNISTEVWKQLYAFSLQLMSDSSIKKNFSSFNTLSLLISYSQNEPYLHMQPSIYKDESLSPNICNWFSHIITMLKSSTPEKAIPAAETHLIHIISLFRRTNRANAQWNLSLAQIKTFLLNLETNLPLQKSAILPLILGYLHEGYDSNFFVNNYVGFITEIHFFIDYLTRIKWNLPMSLKVIVLLFMLLNKDPSSTSDYLDELKLRAEATSKFFLLLNSLKHVVGIAGCHLLLEDESSEKRIFANFPHLLEETKNMLSPSNSFDKELFKKSNKHY